MRATMISALLAGAALVVAGCDKQGIGFPHTKGQEIKFVTPIAEPELLVCLKSLGLLLKMVM